MHRHLPAVTLPLERGRSDQVTELRVLLDDGRVQNIQLMH